MQIILAHGLGQSPSSWNRTVQSFKGNPNIYCPNLLAVTRNGEIAYSHLYQKFSEGCGTVPSPFHICGLSLGGILALHYGIEHPEKVCSLVLIGTQFKMPKRLLAFQNMIFRFMPQKAFEQMGVGRKGLIELSKSMMELDFSDRLDKITCPVLVICGGKDTANRKASERLAEKLRCAEFQIIESAGHEVNADAPEELADLLESFWRKVK